MTGTDPHTIRPPTRCLLLPKVLKHQLQTVLNHSDLRTSCRIEMQCIWPFGHESGSVVRCPSALSRSVPWFALAFLRKGAAVHRQWQLPSSRTHFMDHTNCLCNGMTVWLYVWPSQSRRKKLECLKSLLFEVRCEAVGAGYDQVPIHLGYFQQHFGVYGTGIWPWLTHSRTAIQYSSLQALAGDWNVDLQRFVQVFHWWVSFLDIDFMYFMSLARLWGSYHSEALMQQLAASACETWHLRDPKPSVTQWSWCILMYPDPWWSMVIHGQHGSEGNKRVSHTTQPQARVRIIDIPRSFWTWFCDVLCESLLVFGFCRAIQIRLPHCYKLREHTFQIVLRFRQQLAVCEM